MGDLSDFERGRIVREHLAGASVIKTATLLGVCRATVSKAMSAHTNHGKTTSAKKRTIKPGHQTTGNARVIWSDESSFKLLPTSGRVYVWRTHKEAYNPECLVRFQQ
jgi:IS30 family transposase